MDLGGKFFEGHKIQNIATGENGFTKLISSFLPTFLVIAGFILFIYLIFGGFMMISAAGDEKKTAEGQQALTNAIIGFVIIFASYWIIQIIEVITGVGIVN